MKGISKATSEAASFLPSHLRRKVGKEWPLGRAPGCGPAQLTSVDGTGPEPRVVRGVIPVGAAGWVVVPTA